MSNLICIYRTFDTFEADLIKSYFDNEEVFCFLKTNDASGTLPHLGFSQGGTEIMIHQQDLEASQKILKQIKENLDSSN